MSKRKWKPPKTRHRRWDKFRVVKIESLANALKRGVPIEKLAPKGDFRTVKQVKTIRRTIYDFFQQDSEPLW